MPDNAIPDDWAETTLGAVVETFYNGGTPNTKVAEYWNGTIPWITGADIVDQKVTPPRRHVSSLGVANSATHIIPHGGLLVVTRTGVGKVALAPYDVAISQDITGIIPRDDANAGFLYWWFSTNAERIRKLNQGTSINGILREDLERIRLLLPPCPEQEGIATVLDAIDVAIEKTEAVITATDEMRRGLLQELLTRGVPGLHTEWRRVEGIGTIPSCWDVVRLGGHLAGDPTNGIYKPEHQYGTGCWIIRINDFSAGKMERMDGFSRIEATPEEQRAYEVRQGDVLVNRVNSLSHLGKSVLIGALAEPTLFESNMMRLRASDTLIPKFLELVLCSNYARAHFVARAKKAVAQCSINQGDVKDLLLGLPSKDEQETICKIIGVLDSRQAAESADAAHLRHMKAVLADALLTGRVRVPDALE